MYIISKRFSLASLTSFALTFVTALLLSAAAQAQNKEYTPSVGQEGKDVIWVPTPNELIAKIIHALPDCFNFWHDVIAIDQQRTA